MNYQSNYPHNYILMKKITVLGTIFALALMTLSPLTASANNGKGNDNAENHGKKIAEVKVDLKAKAKGDKDDGRNAVKTNNGLHLGWFKWLNHGWWIHNGGDEHGTSTHATSTDNRDPRITDISLVRSTSTAVIMVKTDEQTSAELRYSTNKDLVASSTALTDTTLAMTHTFNLSGLQADTKYFYQVTVKDANGNITKKPIESFSTKKLVIPDTTVPLILFSTAVEVRPNSAHVIWSTNEVANGKLWISTSTPVNTSVAATRTGAGFVYFHNENVSGLSANTQYYYAITGSDHAGNTSAVVTGSFTTPAM
jgi:hypothetical protein